MKASTECIYCTINKMYELFCKFVDDEEERFIFTKEMLKEMSSYPDNATAPFLSSRVMRIIKKRTDISDLYVKEKELYNNKILSIEEDIFKNINETDDKLLSALKYSMVGNFIDFGAMKTIDDKLLEKIIDTALKQNVDISTYEMFRKELLEADKLCYILDNAGEVIFDKLFIKMIKELNPGIEINIIVRGEPVLNDITYEDAVKLGIDKLGNIIENGTDIAGTDIDEVNELTRNAIFSSDLVISKGQGNFETLYGTEANIYYIFLCKCDMFVRRFSINKFEGIFTKWSDITKRT
ncbi:damage-control phosphatase ARMT1 family protein [Schnuerera sp.]|uniref:damage-control phosphatase ARMT1 family protein n=1 Tax=Schnuerera sp. TaxID=2794844 RepID=UPI002B95F520|nr:ARMT1-like domain-containing protein [Schnuerera sp.]HSH36298.1 ARMT1-like domain-containing protein [Schnuerera sp.]